MSAQNVCVYVTVTLDSAISYPEICCKNLPYACEKIVQNSNELGENENVLGNDSSMTSNITQKYHNLEAKISTPLRKFT